MDIKSIWVSMGIGFWVAAILSVWGVFEALLPKDKNMKIVWFRIVGIIVFAGLGIWLMWYGLK
jgi:hypothetical protein